MSTGELAAFIFTIWLLIIAGFVALDIYHQYRDRRGKLP